MFFYTDAKKVYLNSSANSMFSGLSILSWILFLSTVDTSNVTDMSFMFSRCNNLIDIRALSSWDTSSVTDMGNMFYGCRKIQGTFTIKGNPTLYDEMFVGVATEGAGLVVNYSRNTTNINAIIGTKSSNSNVTKGRQID